MPLPFSSSSAASNFWPYFASNSFSSYSVLFSDSSIEHRHRRQCVNLQAILFEISACNNCMDFLKKAKVVRFRSHQNKYLLADDDQVSVWQNREGTLQNARWTVELISDNPNALRLKSCFGKYLTALSTPFILGIKCNKVLQTTPKTLDPIVEWEPVRDGFKWKMKTANGQFLRASGCNVPPWKDTITHDNPCRGVMRDWVLWDVEVVEIREQQEQEQRNVDNVNDSASCYSTTATQDPTEPDPPSVSRSESSQTQPDSPAGVDLSSPKDHISDSDKKNT
ncbi:hypothetical protein FF1_044989 [Malus domestica]